MDSRGKIIVPGHDRWTEFVGRLSGARICSGGTEQARRALAEMGDVDVAGSLRELARLGGNCDCQIEMDVAALAPNMLEA